MAQVLDCPCLPLHRRDQGGAGPDPVADATSMLRRWKPGASGRGQSEALDGLGAWEMRQMPSSASFLWLRVLFGRALGLGLTGWAAA